MITRIEAYNYLCFEKLDIKVGQYQVLAGANGSGKSALLNIIPLLNNILNKDLIFAFSKFYSLKEKAGNFTLENLIYCSQNDNFIFAIEAEIPKNIKQQLCSYNPLFDSQYKHNEDNIPYKIRYEIRFGICNNNSLEIQEEFLFVIPRKSSNTKKYKNITLSFPSSWYRVIERKIGSESSMFTSEFYNDFFEFNDLEPQKLALANIPGDLNQYPATTWFRDLLEKEVMHYHPDWSRLRQASPAGQTKTLRQDAANLPWIVMNLQESDPDLFEAWVDHVKTALPNVVNIEGVRREEDFHAYLKVTYAGDYVVTSSGLSVGTLQILALTILPYLTNLPKLIFLEEPENGIHPRAIEVVLQSLSSVYDSQIWISTHSPIVLAHTDLDAVIVMQNDINNGSRAILGSQHPRLTDWQGRIDLGSLFAAGVLS